MADVILSPIVDLIVETLGSAAVQEIKSLLGVRNDLDGLRRTLSAIRSVLVDAEKKQIRDEHVRDWLQKLEDVLNDADDLVDEVNTEGLRRQLMHGKKIRKKVRTFFSPNNQVIFRRKMAREIKNIRARLDAISADKQHFRLEVAQEIQPERNARETGTEVDEENVVGRVSEKMEILKCLMSLEAETGSSSTTRRERVSVIPIIGMGGLGKTTLAQVVYNNEEVEKHFNLRLWVCVSDNVDNNLLIEKVVRSITNMSTKDLTMQKLEETVREKINGKRFLLILDDVWNQEINQEWEKLKGFLGKYCVEGSRIIVTTRHDRVARSMGGVQPYCHLGQLNPEYSWNLFKKKAFESLQEPTDPNILDIAHRIVEKCRGVPLAISMIGSMLYSRDPATEWSSFLKKELANIPQKDNDILPTLRLSYDYLPSHMKPCFAYCSLFPKDYEFDVHTLITLWIAQGFIRSDQSQSLEDTGYEYFKDLLWRSFFQEAEKDEVLNMVTTCKMHDLVHDLAIQVAGEKYANIASCEENNLRNSVRHVSIDSSDQWPGKVPSSWLQARKLRSILFPSEYNMIEFESKDIISNHKLLRTLDLHGGGIETVPGSISKLKHLRYLDLSRNYGIKTLPASITKLVNLQTLKLNKCRSLRELPSEIEKLVNLRHLEIKGCYEITHMPRRLSQLTNLQTISLFVLTENVPNGPYSQLNELMGMENLSGEVKIEGIISGMVTTASKLRENNRLRSLHLKFESGEDDASKWKTTLEGLQPHPNLKELSLDQYGGSSLSGSLPMFTNLVKLFVENCSECQQLPSLDKFHSLKEMSLKTLPSLEYITINEGDNYFSTSSSPPVSVLPSLQKLRLVNLPEFRGWWRSGMTENQVKQLQLPSFPRLSSLTIEDCEKLTSMPRYPNIEEELELRNTSWRTFEQTSTAEEASSSSAIPTIVSVSSYPLSKLTSLFLGTVMDLEYFPDERMKGLASLKRLDIRDCPALKYLSPWILYLTSLEELEIESCKEFEGIKWPETPTLTRLRVLKLNRLPKLKYDFATDIQCLTSLEELEIDSREGLEEIKLTPAFTRLRVLKLNRLPYVFAPDIQCLTSLEELEIEDCEGLEEIKLTPALTRLRVLKLSWLGKLKHLSSPGVQQHLTSLEELWIDHCEELQVSNDDSIVWQALKTLRFLDFTGLPQLVSLPGGLQFLTTLKRLYIWFCPNFTGLPDWICKLSSLEILEIINCPNFKSVPASISSLTSLQTLQINGKGMNPREIHEDLDLSCSASGDSDGSTSTAT